MEVDINYTPEALLNDLIKKFQLKNDAQLAAKLDVAAPVISKIRHHQLPVGPTMLLRMHEESCLSIKELRALMGDFRPSFSCHGMVNRKYPRDLHAPSKPLTDLEIDKLT
jgi:hypothetical protein